MDQQRMYAFLLIPGTGILLLQTLRMMSLENAFTLLVLLILEFIVDIGCLTAFMR
jgi:hypothetical protein